MYTLKDEIIKKALVLLGSGLSNTHQGRAFRAKELCDSFAQGVMEEAFISIPWPFAVQIKHNIAPDMQREEVKPFFPTNVTDCLKVISLAPSNRNWYISAKNVFHLRDGGTLDFLIYISREKYEELEDSRNFTNKYTFINYAGLQLAAQTSYALHSDSAFSEMLKAQALKRKDELFQIYKNQFNVDTSMNI